MKNSLKQCVIILNKHKFTTRRKEMLRDVIKKVRLKLMIEFTGVDPSKSICTGRKFNDDEIVITRLECVNQQQIEDVGFEQAVRDVLVNLMTDDYLSMFVQKGIKDDS